MVDFFPEDVSNKVLEKDVFKELPKEFIKTWAEFNADKDKQVIETRGTTGTMFTVPSKNTLFITSAFMDLRNTNTTSSGTVRIFIGATNKAILQINSGSDLSRAVGIATNSQTYPMPIRVDENQTVELSVSSSVGGFGGIQGFLIDKRISP